MRFCAGKCAISGLRTSISGVDDEDGAPSSTPSRSCKFAGCVVVELSAFLRPTAQKSFHLSDAEPQPRALDLVTINNEYSCSTHQFPRNGRLTCWLTAMDRFFLHIICASILLLVTAFALGTPGLSAPGVRSEAPPEKALLLRVAIR